MAADDSLNKEIEELQKRLASLDRERMSILAAIERLQQLHVAEMQSTPSSQDIGKITRATSGLSNAEKIGLFRSFFRGRDDVFPLRWQNSETGKAGYAPACNNEWVRGICEKPRIKCSNCPNQAFVPVSDEMVRGHLQGRDIANSGKPEPLVAGVYPLMADETCWFLAADFDKQFWQRDALAFLATCREKGVPAAIERSRSGNGGHVWIFFSEPVPASEARKLGAYLVTETMERCPDLGFESYDRFFPSQDTMPAGGFGNLIALPLQNGPRQHGNSVFIDDELRPYDDQWAFLASLGRMSRSEVAKLVDQASAAGRIVGVRLPLEDDEDEPWLTPPSRRKTEQPIIGVMPERVEVVLANQAYIDRTALPPGLVNRLIRLAAFQNPEFYAAQAMRLPTYGKPRVISCAELFAKHIALPRGCVDAALDLLTANSIRPEVRDERYGGTPLEALFVGTLTMEQQAAMDALAAHDTGVLAATTAFGKTVVACNLIAARNTSTLVLVHRQQLLDQWVTRLRTFLDVDADRVGVIRGGCKRPTGFIDVATIQSLVRKGEVSDLVADYGHLVVDECHHLSAVSFEAPVDAEPNSTSASFGDWALRCQRLGSGAETQRVCEVTQQVHAQDQQNPVAELAIGRLKKADPLRLTVVLPVNVTISNPPSFSTDRKVPELLDLAWRKCLPGGCFADALLKDDVLRRWKAQTSAEHITWTDASGRDLAIELSFRGLTQALDALSREP